MFIGLIDFKKCDCCPSLCRSLKNYYVGLSKVCPCYTCCFNYSEVKESENNCVMGESIQSRPENR